MYIFFGKKKAPVNIPPTPVVSPVPPPKIEDENKISETPQTTQNTANLSISSPEIPTAPVSITKTVVVNRDPFCLYGRKNFVALPDFYLKSAYKSSTFTAAIPSMFSKCLTNNNQPIDIVFFLYNKGLMLPWKPLVRGSFVVSEVKDYATEQELYSSSGIANSNPGFFDIYKNQRFSKIVLKKMKLEDYPSFYPLPPDLHPFATLLPDVEFQRKLTEQNAVIIDARSEKKKKKSPVTTTVADVIFRGEKIHDKVVDLHEIKAKKFRLIKKLGPQTPILIFGAGARDFSAYNVANHLASFGFFNTYILNSPSNIFHFKPAKDLPNSFSKISPDQAKAEKSSQTVLFVDLRRSNLSHGTIKDAYIVPFSKEASSDLEEKVKYSPKGEELKNLLYSLRKKIKRVVLVGSNDADEKSVETAMALRPFINVPTYWLADGFRAWSFNAKYRWEDIPKTRPGKNKRRGLRNSPPPPRLEVKSALGKKSLSFPYVPTNKDKSVKPSKVDRQTLKERKQEILAKRKKPTKDQSEKPH